MYPRRRPARRAGARDQLAGFVRDRSRHQLFRRQGHLPAAPGDPVSAALAIASDALGFLALALFYPTGDLHLAAGTLIMAVAIGIAVGLRRARVMSFWPFLLGAGSVSWCALYWSGLHPALALVPIMPFLPHAARDPGFFVDARATDRDALSQFEVWWRYPAQMALFFFGLVNAGAPLHAVWVCF